MPRRKKTKGAVASRPKPKLPEGDEGKDLSEIARQEKLDILLKDFDKKAQTYIHDLEGYKKELLKSLEAVHRREMVKLKPIMNMSVQDFLSAGGELDENAMKNTWEQSNCIDDKLIEEQLNSKYQLDTLKRPTRRVGAMDTISEEGSNENQPPRTSRRKGMAAPTTNARKSTRTSGVKSKGSKFVTPYHGQISKASRLDTPLQTPRFDPRLPVTPWVKLSMAGSPIPLSEDDVDVLVGGNAISEESLEKDIEALPSAALEKLHLKLHRLNERVTSIFKMHGMKK